MIKDDNTRYFIGLLNEKNNKNDISLINTQLNGNNPKINVIPENIIHKGKNSLSKNKKENDEQENKYIESKEKMSLWFKNLYISSTKKNLLNSININKEIKNERNRKVFSKLISQNYKTLFYPVFFLILFVIF